MNGSKIWPPPKLLSDLTPHLNSRSLPCAWTTSLKDSWLTWCLRLSIAATSQQSPAMKFKLTAVLGVHLPHSLIQYTVQYLSQVLSKSCQKSMLYTYTVLLLKNKLCHLSCLFPYFSVFLPFPYFFLKFFKLFCTCRDQFLCMCTSYHLFVECDVRQWVASLRHGDNMLSHNLIGGHVNAQK